MISSSSSSPLSLSTLTPTRSLNPPKPHRTTFRQPIAAAAATTHNYEQNRTHQNKNFSYLTMSTATNATCSSLYEILGIPVGATSHEIKAAYRRLARSCHPDVVAIDRRDNSSGDEFMKIHAAYSTLSDPEKRAVYDRKILRRNIRRSPLTSSGYGGYRGRSWETDQCW